MPSVYIKTYGCQMNERDSEAVAAQLVAKGYTLAPSEAVADVILLNTCSVRDLAALYPGVRSVSVVPVGLTRHHKYGHRPHTAQEAANIVDTVQAWQESYRAQFGARFVYLTDEWYLISGRPLPKKRDYDGLALQENGLGMVRDFLDEWQRLKRKEVRGVRKGATYERATLVTATLFAPVLQRVARDFSTRTGVPLDVVAIRNERLGETITVAGLLQRGRRDAVHVGAAAGNLVSALCFEEFDRTGLGRLPDILIMIKNSNAGGRAAERECADEHTNRQ